jgi:hypothetical protein
LGEGSRGVCAKFLCAYLELCKYQLIILYNKLTFVTYYLESVASASFACSCNENTGCAVFIFKISRNVILQLYIVPLAEAAEGFYPLGHHTYHPL